MLYPCLKSTWRMLTAAFVAPIAIKLGASRRRARLFLRRISVWLRFRCLAPAWKEYRRQLGYEVVRATHCTSALGRARSSNTYPSKPMTLAARSRATDTRESRGAKRASRTRSASVPNWAASMPICQSAVWINFIFHHRAFAIPSSFSKFGARSRQGPRKIPFRSV